MIKESSGMSGMIKESSGCVQTFLLVARGKRSESLSRWATFGGWRGGCVCVGVGVGGRLLSVGFLRLRFGGIIGIRYPFDA